MSDLKKRILSLVKQDLEDIELELLEDLDKLYIDACYPGDLGLLPNGKPTLSDAAAFKELAEAVFTTISKALSN